MDKEEAMKILKDFHDKSALFSVRTALDTIIPELNKSEDNMIKEELIKHLKDGVEGYMPAGDSEDYARWLAWLEKQGEHANFRNKIQIGDKVTRNEAGMLVNMSQLNRIAKPRRAKPVDKVEPKFKVGDWIVNDYCFGKVIEITNDAYLLDTGQGIPFSCEHNVHLWTIQDAKDGDVLVFKNNIGGIIICKSPSDYDTRSYCRLIRDNLINKEESGWDSTLLVPATKEQRDLLFQKMKEAGYEWSEDTHELKKISQRMVSAEAKEALYDKPTDEEMKELLRTEYEKGRADTIAKMKSSWSEEDELNLKQAIYVCHQNGYTAVENWLKSLKDRYTWKPSEEQLECLHDAINHYHTNGYPASKLNELYEQMSKIYKL